MVDVGWNLSLVAISYKYLSRFVEMKKVNVWSDLAASGSVSAYGTGEEGLLHNLMRNLETRYCYTIDHYVATSIFSRYLIYYFTITIWS